MLGSAVLSVRLGGIYALARLADEHPEKYHVPIIQLFCTYARNPTESEGGQAKPKNRPRRESTLQEDVQAVMTAIGSRSKAGLGYEVATKSAGLEEERRLGDDQTSGIRRRRQCDGCESMAFLVGFTRSQFKWRRSLRSKLVSCIFRWSRFVQLETLRSKPGCRDNHGRKLVSCISLAGESGVKPIPS